MIEVNLLPSEYRTPETTNLPLLATLVLGFGVVGAVLFWFYALNTKLTSLTSERDKKEERKQELLLEEKEVDKLTQDIRQQRSRQDTIIEISQSKVMWSLKLSQLAQVMKAAPTFWISNLTLTKGNRSQPGKLALQLSAAGNDLSSVSRFEESLKADPNFFYHFADLLSRDFRIEDLAGRYVNANERIVFRIELPLATQGKD